MHPLHASEYVAGMPQLAYAGLSENWLLKECGQRHWAGIAALHGMALPSFADVSGRQAYAAFTAISLSNVALNDIGEHDAFEIGGGVAQAGRAQYYSRHQLSRGGAPRATLQMLSAFVQRLQDGNNQSVVRATLGARAPHAPADADAAAPEAEALLKASKDFRGGLRQACLGMRAATAPTREFVFLPSPESDFNGANFMYFATFQALVERAEWRWFRRMDLPQLAERQLYYYGNVNIGDEVRVELLAQRDDDDDHFGHWCRLVRVSDNAKIADVVTLKRRTGR